MVAGLLVGLAPVALAQEITPTTGITWRALGRISARSAQEIGGSSWSIGAETLDRGYADFDQYRRYLGALGAKRVRLQAGWARCERSPGTYDFSWLDEAVDGALAQGVQPWLELSYGNSLYAGGGDPSLGGGFPRSPTALAAWDRWCRALVEHFSGRVREWQVWNEPDINQQGTATAKEYVELFVRTAEIIRAVQPHGSVWALALARAPEYAADFLSGMSAKGKLDLVDAITFHGYPRNPDDIGLLERLRAECEKTNRAIPLRQGETGAPSRFQANFALSRIRWSETTQAKWDLRRMLVHHAQGIPFNLFTLCDLHYGRDSIGSEIRRNYKGLLESNPDLSIHHVKAVYRAAQCVFAVFDDRLQPIAGLRCITTALQSVAVSGYRDGTGRGDVVAAWFNDAPPGESSHVSEVAITVAGVCFQEPVLVDVRTGIVYAIPSDAWSHDRHGVTFDSLPVYDSPVLVAEKGILPGISNSQGQP